MVAYLLFPGIQVVDKIFREHIAFLQPRIFGRHLAAYGLGPLLAIAHGREPVAGDAMPHEIGHHRLGAPLREPLVILHASLVVAMGTQFDGHIGILVEQFYQFVECFRTLGREIGLVKLIEDIIYQHRRRDRGQRKLQHMLFALVRGLHAQFFAVVEKALTRSHEQIVHARLHHLLKRTVAFHAHLSVGAVAAHDIDLCRRQFVAFHLVDPPFYRLHDFGIVKRVDVVEAPSVSAVGGEKAAVVRPFERHAEIVTLGIERIARVG